MLLPVVVCCAVYVRLASKGADTVESPCLYYLA
jgi:hypothetical protein